MPMFEFRKFQTLCDLRRVIEYQKIDALLGICYYQAQAKELYDATASINFSMHKCVEKTVQDALWTAATSPQEDVDTFLSATAIVLIDAINTGVYQHELGWFWDTFSKDYRAAPPKVKTAIMYGFSHLAKHRLISENCKPSTDDLTTTGLSAVESLLIPIAKSLSAEDISVIAMADYGDDVERYTQSLKNRLATQNLAFPQDEEFWFADEVINLVSHDPTSLGYIQATAFLLLDAIRNQDYQSKAQFRFESQWREFAALPSPIKTAFYCALRYLDEADEHWTPKFKASDTNTLDQRLAIGW